MPNYYWTLESWGDAQPPENADEIIALANAMINLYTETHGEAETEHYSEQLWERYCSTGTLTRSSDIVVRTRTYMEHNPDETTASCAPYRSENGRVSLAYDGYICGLIIDGEEIDVPLAQSRTEQEPLWERIARTALDSEDDAYLLDQETRRYSWREIALMDAVVEHGCATCPWKDVCDAMAEEMIVPADEAVEYAEDEILDEVEDA